ncbi:zinc-binding dehydrogenase [Candidatus Woesearchaeota archaeon]|nr:zinc-binding dehydrogenase [Candidatus Woesearchaeota archaeon]
MKAAILEQQRSPLVVDDVQLPQSLDYGQVLVKIHYSSICGAQINEIDGVKGPDKYLPHLLGHEGSGVVEKIGPGVRNVGPGDKVVLHWRKGSGIESATPKYMRNGRQVNAGWVTTFNEYAVVSENRVTKIPDDADLKSASVYGCAVTTAFGVVRNDAMLGSGQSVVVFGSGGVGVMVVLAASLVSAYPIIAVDVNDSKLDAARQFGATHVVNSRKADARAAVSSILPDGADAAIDTTGIREVRELAYELANKDGTAVLVGVPKAGEKISIDSFPLHFNKKITGSHGGDSNPSYDIPRLMRLQKAGKFGLDGLMSIYSLDKINDAIADLRAGKVIKCVIKMQ